MISQYRSRRADSIAQTISLMLCTGLGRVSSLVRRPPFRIRTADRRSIRTRILRRSRKTSCSAIINVAVSDLISVPVPSLTHVSQGKSTRQPTLLRPFPLTAYYLSSIPPHIKPATRPAVMCLVMDTPTLAEIPSYSSSLSTCTCSAILSEFCTGFAEYRYLKNLCPGQVTYLSLKEYRLTAACCRSGSMGSYDRTPARNTPSYDVISATSNDRYGAVLSACYRYDTSGFSHDHALISLSFWTARQAVIQTAGSDAVRRDAYSVILFNEAPATIMQNDYSSNPDQLLSICLREDAWGNTNFAMALHEAEEVMTRNVCLWHRAGLSLFYD